MIFDIDRDVYFPLQPRPFQKFFQKLGLEWFYRLIKEPKRIGRMMKLPKFLFAAIGCKLRGKKHHGEG